MRTVLTVAIMATFAVSMTHAGTLTGQVRRDGKPAAGAFVTARDSVAGVAVSVRCDGTGRYTLHTPAGKSTVTARVRGAASAGTPAPAGGGTLDLQLTVAVDAATDAPPRAFLDILPDGNEKRRFVVDCMGCHSLSAANVFDVLPISLYLAQVRLCGERRNWWRALLHAQPAMFIDKAYARERRWLQALDLSGR
jgi:hypothetical protein